jgi:hypothetical protein
MEKTNRPRAKAKAQWRRELFELGQWAEKLFGTMSTEQLEQLALEYQGL